MTPPFHRPSFESVLQRLDGVDGWLTEAQARALYGLAERCPSGGRIVEIGSFRGRSTIVLASAADPTIAVMAIDPHAGNDRGPQELEGFADEASQRPRRLPGQPGGCRRRRAGAPPAPVLRRGAGARAGLDRRALHRRRPPLRAGERRHPVRGAARSTTAARWRSTTRSRRSVSRWRSARLAPGRSPLPLRRAGRLAGRVPRPVSAGVARGSQRRPPARRSCPGSSATWRSRRCSSPVSASHRCSATTADWPYSSAPGGADAPAAWPYVSGRWLRERPGSERRPVGGGSLASSDRAALDLPERMNRPGAPDGLGAHQPVDGARGGGRRRLGGERCSTTRRRAACIARGLGRSYGDAAQNGGGSRRCASRGDVARGPARSRGAARSPSAPASASTTCCALIVPRGWFVPVTPGTRFVTVGGAIASRHPRQEPPRRRLVRQPRDAPRRCCSPTARPIELDAESRPGAVLGDRRRDGSDRHHRRRHHRADPDRDQPHARSTPTASGDLDEVMALMDRGRPPLPLLGRLDRSAGQRAATSAAACSPAATTPPVDAARPAHGPSNRSPFDPASVLAAAAARAAQRPDQPRHGQGVQRDVVPQGAAPSARRAAVDRRLLPPARPGRRRGTGCTAAGGSCSTSS